MGLFDGTPLERPVVCEQCGLAVGQCRCAEAPPPPVPPQSQRLRLAVERRKQGKQVTVISGFTEPPYQFKQTLTQLKNHCGAGGTLHESRIELQGDHRQRARHYLQQLGYVLL